MRIYLIIAFILFCGPLFPQKADSLRALLRSATADTLEAKLLLDLGHHYFWLQPDSSRHYFEKARDLYERAGDQSGKATALFHIGRTYEGQDEFRQARNWYDKALAILEGLGDQKQIAILCHGIGHSYLREAFYPRALEYDLRALRLYEELKDTAGLGTINGNIGTVYIEQGDYPKARVYFGRALEIAKLSDNQEDIGNQYGSFGTTYYYEGKLEKALEYYFKAVDLFQKINNRSRAAIALGNIGAVYADMANAAISTGHKAAGSELRHKAQQFYEKGLKLHEEFEEKYGIAICLGNLGSLFLQDGQHLKAEEMLLKSLSLSKEIGSIDDQRLAHENLSKLYDKTGRYDLALSHYKRFIVARDSIFNEENTKKTVRAEMNYEFDKKEAAAKLEQEKREAVAAAESKKQRIILLAISGFGLLVLGFAVFAYRSFLQKKKANIEISKQKHIIEEKQKEILDSIHYAKRIQQSLLPNEKHLERTIARLKV